MVLSERCLGVRNDLACNDIILLALLKLVKDINKHSRMLTHLTFVLTDIILY